MKLGYTLFYVGDVEKTMNFYSSAFGLEKGFFHDSKQYGEMISGKTNCLRRDLCRGWSTTLVLASGRPATQSGGSCQCDERRDSPRHPGSRYRSLSSICITGARLISEYSICTSAIGRISRL